MEVFSKVVFTKIILDRFEINHVMSRNLSAGSCVDAAMKRIRYQKQGIPLKDELKTFFGEYTLETNRKCLVTVNVAGDKRINFNKVRKALKTKKDIKPCQPNTLNLFGVTFGEINPFLLDYIFFEAQNKKVKTQFDGFSQLFCSDLKNREGSMMTNAGDKTWGVEFNINDVIYKLRNASSDFILTK